MKKSITKNYIYNLIYQILIIILPLITTPYISRVLGAENIGIYSYTISIVTYFILFGSLGIAMYGQREIAYLQDNKQKYSKTFWEILILRFITMFISMAIFYLIFTRNGEYSVYYKILLLEMIANCLDISWLFQGLEEFKKVVIRNIIIKIISIVLIFIFIKNSNDLIIYFIIYVLSTLFGNITLWTYLHKFLAKIEFKELNIIKHLKPTISLFIPQIAVQIYTVLDKVMIGAIITDKSEVGYYEQSQKVIKMLLTVVTSLGTVMVPRMANTFINGDTRKIQEYMKRAFNFVFFIAFPMVFGIIAVSNNFVPLFFGQGYEKVSILMCVISPIVLAIGLSNVIGTQYLLPTKRQKEYTISVIVGAIVNFGINIVLIKRCGALGASVGTVIAEISVTILQFVFVKKDFKLLEILKLSIKYIIASLIMFAICIIIENFIKNNLYCIIAQVIVGIGTYGIMLLLQKDEFTYLLLNKIKLKFIK
ncbi:MAG: flippase [Clostridia bacterium]|nr:flippase [Clostridia bacterium]